MSTFLIWVRIAARNIWKNARRSAFTIAAIAFGFASVNVFHGFANYIYLSLEDAYIYVRAEGHITIFKQGFREGGAIDPVRYLISDQEALELERLFRTDPRISAYTPTLRITGLASNGEISTIFSAGGRVPSDVRAIRAQARSIDDSLQLFDGQPLDDNLVHGVGLSKGLARLLGLSVGSDGLMLVAPTIHGSMNALDATVLQTFHAPSEELEDKLVTVPLRYAQMLYDTTHVDRYTLLLGDMKATQAVISWLEEQFETRGLDMEAKAWRELATFYVKTRQMFEVIFLFIFLIVFVIVVMSIINTMGMAVMERIREFGTLRALGLRRFGVIRLVAIESAILTVVGSLLGILISLVVWLSVEILQPRWVPPQMAKEIPLHIELEPTMLLGSFVFLAFVAALASLLPARRATRLSVVDALGHV